MIKDEHNDFLYKIVAIDQAYRRGEKKLAERETLLIIAKLVTEIYDMQHPEEIKKS